METKEAITAEGTGEVVIQIEHLSKSFAGNHVLRDINLQLHRGENLAVLGKSGQGKSVTIKCIVGLIEYDSGTVNVLGKEVKSCNDEEIREMRKQVGFLFQGSALYDSMSVYDNLAFPLTRALKMKSRKEMDKRIDEVLEGVGLQEAVHKMPSELSGGMRKRIALARSLILKPAIMLYDEPTTGLDPVTSREISDLIVSMQQRYEMSSIIITHDMPCARVTSNRMLMMDKGVFIAEGTYEQLEKSDNELVHSFLTEVK